MADLSPIGTAGTPMTWAKQVSDVANQTIATASSIGFLETNNSRVSIAGKLPANETQQVYSFQAFDNGNGNTLINGTGDVGLRVQLMTQTGRVLADSKSGMGTASSNWTTLKAGTYSLPKGTYYVKISRDGTVPNSQPVGYVVMARMGKTFTNDYQTTEMASTPTYSTSPVASAAPSIITSSLLTGGAAAAIFASADLFGTIANGESAAQSTTTSSS